MSEQLLTELATLERELQAHEGYLKRQWLSPEGYKKWYARKQSLLGKIKRRKQKAGILYSNKEFLEIYNEYKEKDSTILTFFKRDDPKLTSAQNNKLQQLSIHQEYAPMEEREREINQLRQKKL